MLKRLNSDLHSTMQRLKLSVPGSKTWRGRVFTFHYAKIKTQEAKKGLKRDVDLHSTMQRLKHKKSRSDAFGIRFTFHYAKIKTAQQADFFLYKQNLHSTMQRLKHT